MTPPVIGLSGVARSGKDTVAAHLVKQHGYTLVRLADPIRTSLLALNPYVTPTTRLNVIIDRVGWDDAKSLIPEVRVLMQRLGTEAGRDVHGEDLWVNAARRLIDPILAAGGRVVIPDVRFPNEADTVRSLNGHVWRIERPAVTAPNQHPTETVMNTATFDHYLRNTTTVTDLHRAIDAALSAP